MVVVGLGREARGYQFKLEPDSKMVHVATNFGVRNALGLHVRFSHKVLTYVEYRTVSGVFQAIDPPPPLHPASVSSPRTKGGGVHTLAGAGSIFWKTPDTGLASFSLIPLRVLYMAL
jgi:hypothetical protein